MANKGQRLLVLVCMIGTPEDQCLIDHRDTRSRSQETPGLMAIVLACLASRLSQAIATPLKTQTMHLADPELSDACPSFEVDGRLLE